MDTAKAKIKKAVTDYIALFPDEYALFKDQVMKNRSALADEKFGIAQESGNDMRALFEMPVALHDIITNALNADELAWFKYGGTDKREGGRWFATHFPAFRLPDKV